MTNTLLLKQVRPMGGATVDLLVRDGRIAEIAPKITPPADTTVIDGQNQLLLPGLVNAHAHVDKNLFGRGWHRNELANTTIRGLVDNERQIRMGQGISAQTQSAREVELAVAAGVTHVRTHVDIDTDAGLAHFEGVLATREQYKESVTMQTVAFPQSGMLICPGTVELLEEALKLGAECIGGLDPSTVDRDPVKHLDTIFGLAERHGVEVDIHLHEPGTLGAFAVELIIERTKALGMQGKVTISHVFCLGMIDDTYLDRLIAQLVEQRIAIMSLGSGRSEFPPLKRLYEAGVRLCTGTDGVRDTWGPYNGVDLLERVKLLGYRSGFRNDADLEMLLAIATYGGANIMDEADYGLAVGCWADLVVVPGETTVEAIITQPPRSYVVKRGNLVASAGTFHGHPPVDR
ncbi:MAG TPA: amidohydrolase family protein [Caldilineaceae bacterium]|nr:amidohydrolase family protein [Caldilineaceae bacterium]